jgi:hypothetical protein
VNHFDVRQTKQAGGGWLVHRTSDSPMSDHPFADPTAGVHLAFRTLSHARSYIASVVKIDKRVRMSKQSADHYTYKH